MNERNKWVEKLEKAWRNNHMLDYAYQVACLYNTGDMVLITEVMAELKYRLDNE
jgi:hypothetical protein